MRDRVKEFLRLPTNLIDPNEKNWRTHPREQVNAFKEVLDEIGFADVVIVREQEDGRYTLLDGHLRVGILPDETVPAIVVDLNDEEADILLMTMDPLSAMAKENTEQLDTLRDSMRDDIAERMKDIPTISREVERDSTPHVTRDGLVCPDCGFEFSS